MKLLGLHREREEVEFYLCDLLVDDLHLGALDLLVGQYFVSDEPIGVENARVKTADEDNR